MDDASVMKQNYIGDISEMRLIQGETYDRLLV